MSEAVVEASEIKINRRPSLDIKGLTKDIKANGLRVPVLVDQDFVLIDGLRRLEALKALGWKVPVTVAETYEEAISNLDQAHTEPLTDARRIWQINQDLGSLLEERTHRLRAASQRGIPRSSRFKGRANNVRSREMFEVALKNVYVTKVCQVYRAAEAGHELAKQLLPLLEDGTYTPNMALNRLGQYDSRKGGNVTVAREQRALLVGAIRSLSGVTKGLEKMGFPVKIPKEEYENLVKQIKEHRTELSRMLGILERGGKRD